MRVETFLIVALVCLKVCLRDLSTRVVCLFGFFFVLFFWGKNKKYLVANLVELHLTSSQQKDMMMDRHV